MMRKVVPQRLWIRGLSISTSLGTQTGAEKAHHYSPSDETDYKPRTHVLVHAKTPL